jgi:hypothetical protein
LKNQLDENEEKELGTFFKSVEDKAFRYGIKLLCHGEFTGKGVSEKGSLLDTCANPWFYRYLHPDGRIMLCARRKPVGNLLQTSYVEIMNSWEANEIKRDVLTRSEACLTSCSAAVTTTEL